MDSFNRKASIYNEQLPTEQLFLYAKSIKKELFLLELFIVDRRFSVKAVQSILKIPKIIRWTTFFEFKL